jgi:hypothetical protein
MTNLPSSPERTEVIRGLESLRDEHAGYALKWREWESNSTIDFVRDANRANAEREEAHAAALDAALSLLRERPASETTKPASAMCPQQPNEGPHCACWQVGSICCACRNQGASETEGT